MTGLTDRERQVCALVAEGLTNSEIGERLYLSHYTVKTHLRRIFQKTGAISRAQLVTYADTKVKVRTSAEVVQILRNLRAERAAVSHRFGSIGQYRQEGELRVLDELIEQIGAARAEPRMMGGRA
jgi:DNA-binding CsgD family transcriptional regulator